MENKNCTTEETVRSKMNHKSIYKKIVAIVILIGLFVVGLYVYATTPIVVSIRNENDSTTRLPEGKVFTFYAYPDRCDVSYYLTDGSNPRYVTVDYLNRRSECLTSAILEGHMSITELDRFGIEYGIIENNRIVKR